LLQKETNPNLDHPRVKLMNSLMNLGSLEKNSALREKE